MLNNVYYITRSRDILKLLQSPSNMRFNGLIADDLENHIRNLQLKKSDLNAQTKTTA